MKEVNGDNMEEVGEEELGRVEEAKTGEVDEESKKTEEEEEGEIFKTWIHAKRFINAKVEILQFLYEHNQVEQVKT